jgi:predicted small secreted protein
MVGNAHVPNVRVDEEEPLMRRALDGVKILLVIAFALAVSGCNTMKGFGEDLSTLGNKITGSAEKHTDR